VDPDSSKKRKSAKVEEIRNEIEGIRQTSIISNTKESFQRVSSIVDSPSTNSFLLGTPNYIMDLPEHFLMDIPSSPLQLVTSPSKSKSQVDWNHYIQGIIGPPSTPNFNSNSSSPLSQFIPIHAIPTHEFITDENILKNPHFRHIFDGKTEKNETISMYCREEYFPLMAEFISKRISQEEAVTFMRRMREFMRPLILRYREHLTPAKVMNVFHEFDSTLKMYAATFDTLSVPVMIHSKEGVIHYVNKSYRELTGFDLEIPTDIQKFVAYEQMSSSSYLKLRYLSQTAMILSLSDIKSNKCSIMLPMEWYSYGKYIDVTASITMPVSSIGLVLMEVVVILPLIFTPVLEGQLEHNAKLIGMQRSLKGF